MPRQARRRDGIPGRKRRVSESKGGAKVGRRHDERELGEPEFHENLRTHPKARWSSRTSERTGEPRARPACTRGEELREQSGDADATTLLHCNKRTRLERPSRQRRLETQCNPTALPGHITHRSIRAPQDGSLLRQRNNPDRLSDSAAESHERPRVSSLRRKTMPDDWRNPFFSDS